MRGDRFNKFDRHPSDLTAAYDVQVEGFTKQHTIIAVEAFSRFGKGGYRAGLNYGDCMANAIARVLGAPLVCKGNDFRKTDLPVISPAA